MLLGLSTAAQATNDALDRGMSKEQAFWNGLMSGVFECVFEKWSIGEFKALKNVASTQAKDIALNIAKSMLVNASEETLTEIANVAYDTIVNGDFSQYETKVRQYVVNGLTETEAKNQAARDLGWQVAESGAGGALMGLGFSTVAGASAVVKNAYNQLKSNQALKGQQVTQLKDAAAQIVTEVLKQNPNHVQAQTLKVQLNSGKSLSVSDLLTLQTLAEESTTAVAQPTSAENSTMNSPRVVTENRAFTNGNAINKNTAINQVDVAQSLRSKGISSQKADGIAEAITARLNGQELTRPQRDILRSALESPTVQSVVSEFMQKKSNGIDNARSAVYDDSNIRDGLTDEEKTALWDLAHQRVGAFSNHDYATVTEDSVPYQDRNAFSEGIRVVGTDTVTYRRVQGGSGNNASQVRIKVNADGSSSIPNKEANLSISIDGGEHAQYFLNKRGGDAQIIEIDVPKWFDDFLQENAIPQVNYKTNPRNQGGAAPKITDITTPGNCFELPAPWIEWLEEYGRNARIVNP